MVVGISGLFTLIRNLCLYSLHEHGVYDLPAIINYVIKETNTEQVHYIGYSMGSTTFFIFTSEKKDYQIKIRSSICLAPVANIYHSTSPLRELAPWAKTLKVCIRTLGVE